MAKGPDTEIEIVESAKDHPLLAGVQPFRSAGSLYKNEGLASDCQILMTGKIPEAHRADHLDAQVQGRADFLHLARPSAGFHGRQLSPFAGQCPVLDRGTKRRGKMSQCHMNTYQLQGITTMNRTWIWRACTAIALAAALSQSGVSGAEVARSTDLIDDVKNNSKEIEIEFRRDVVYGTGGGEDLLLDLAMPKGLDSAGRRASSGFTAARGGEAARMNSKN